MVRRERRFLKLPVGARAIGLGGAYSAVEGDASSIGWNPASLASIKKPELSLMHNEWLAETRYEFIGFINPMKIGNLGAGLIYLSSGEMEKRGEDRSLQGSFSAYNLALVGSYSREISEALSFGTNVKFIRMVIENESANGIGFDFGLFSKNILPVSLALTIQNVGPNMKFINESFNLPSILTIGASYSLDSLLFAVDFKKQLFMDKLSVSFGVEYMPFSLLALRAGYSALALGMVNREMIYSSTSSLLKVLAVLAEELV